jgi:hypothetical protein
MDTLAYVLQETNEYPKAVGLLARSLMLREKHLGAEHPLLARVSPAA